MTADVTLRDDLGSGGQIAQSGPVTRRLAPDANAVAALLHRVSEPFRLIGQLRPWLDRIHRMWPWPLDCAAEFRDEALDRHQRMPSIEQLAAAEKAISAAAYGDTDEALTRLIIARMLDALPSAKNLDSAAYIDELTESLMFDADYEPAHFSPAVVNEARRTTRDADKFAPAPAEFRERCVHCKIVLIEMLERVYTLIELRSNCEEILIACGDGALVLGPDDGFDDWE
jgi:hypothetical protein